MNRILTAALRVTAAVPTTLRPRRLGDPAPTTEPALTRPRS
jgi:hypothetical protein